MTATLKQSLRYVQAGMLKPADKFLFLILVDNADKDGHVTTTYDELQTAMRMSRSAISDTFKRLISNQYLCNVGRQVTDNGGRFMIRKLDPTSASLWRPRGDREPV